MRDQILKARYWPVEIMRSAIPTGVKGRRVIFFYSKFICFSEVILNMLGFFSQIKDKTKKMNFFFKYSNNKNKKS